MTKLTIAFRNFSKAPNQYSATCETLGYFQLLATESDMQIMSELRKGRIV